MKYISLVIKLVRPCIFAPVDPGCSFTHKNRVVPCRLSDLGVANGGTLTVTCGARKYPIESAVLLLRGSQEPVVQEREEKVHAIVSEGVKDALGGDGEVRVFSMGPLESLASFQVAEDKLALVVVSQAMLDPDDRKKILELSCIHLFPVDGSGFNEEDAITAFGEELKHVPAMLAMPTLGQKRKLANSEESSHAG